MPYSIAQAAAQLGVHPATVRRHIRSGKLPAELVDGQWTIHDCAIAQVIEQSHQPEQGVHNGDSSAHQMLIAVLERQLEEKDRQIRELHVLLQAAQEQTQRMLSEGHSPARDQRRWWWPF